MVVLLQKLEVKAVLDLAFENFDKLCDSCLLGAFVLAGSEVLDNFSGKRLVLFVNNVEGDLECL